MARRFARAADTARGDRVAGAETTGSTTVSDVSDVSDVSGVSGASEPAATPAARKRKKMAHAIGVDLARQFGWRAADYTQAELTVLGEHLIADHVRHGDHTDHVRLLASLAKAAGKQAAAHSSMEDNAADDAAPEDEHDTLARQIDAFMLTEFKEEFAVAHAAEDLAAIQPPTRAEAAGDAEYARQLDAYARSATDKTIVLFDGWLDWIGKKHGVDLKDARVEIHAANLQYYYPETRLVQNRSIPHDGPTRREVPAAGYIATIPVAGAVHRYFLSTADGGIHPIPHGEPTTDWALREQETVFGAERGQSYRPLSKVQTGPRTRVALPSLAHGRRADLRTWLAPILQKRFEQTPPAPPARPGETGAVPNAGTPGHGAIDTILDFIPFRRTFVAIRDGDWKTALLSGAVDIVSIVIPMMGSGLRLAAGATRGLVSGMRGVGGEAMATLAQGRARASAVARRAPRMRTGITAALRSLGDRNGVAHGLRPLDIESMAAALHDTHPHLANALERVAVRAHGASMPDGWWRVKLSPSAAADAAGIDTLAPVTAQGADDTALSLLRYGSDAARAYTRFKFNGERAGAVLQADGEGRLYASLPVDTLGRYRVSDPDLLRELGAQRPDADGIVAWRGGIYARIVDDYVQIARDRASDNARPAWRVLAPPGVRRDVVIHRIAYDKDNAFWRRADAAGLKGGGSGYSLQARRRVGPDAAGNEGAPAEQTGQSQTGQSQAGPSGTRRGDASSSADSAETRLKIPPPLPSIAPGSRQLSEFRQLMTTRIAGTPARARINAVQALLTRMQEHPRGKAILSAMQAYHEMTGRAPDIVLREESNALYPRPSLVPSIRTTRWNLDLAALGIESLDSALDELAAVYANMTGILQGTNPFVQTLRDGTLHDGRPLLDMKQEAGWTRWVSEDQAGYSIGPAGSKLTRPQRQIVIDKLRLQLQSARCHGGSDRSTLIHALRNRTVTEPLGLKLDLSSLQMTAIPPLPVDVHTLIVDDNPIADWSRLPRGLTTLKARRTRNMSSLLRYLPPTLRELDLSNNFLKSIPGHRLPRGLIRLTAEHNQLGRIPDKLPSGLLHLLLNDNVIGEWPDAWPGGLRELELSRNLLQWLPRNLPRDLERLGLADNMFWRIQEEAFPPRLRILDLADNESLAIVSNLPESLEILYLERSGLGVVPKDLPQGLRELYVSGLRLKYLPENLPRGLTVLKASKNLLTALPPDITELTECDIYLDENPISLNALPARGPGQQGPVYHLETATLELNPEVSRTMTQAIRHWLGKQESAAATRWEAIDTAMQESADMRGATLQFVHFLDKLRGTGLYRYRASRAAVVEWLEDLSLSEREALLKSTLEICEGTGESCADRAIMTWGELNKLRVSDDIRLGRYNGRAADALQIMRQLFRQNKLMEIAYRKLTASPDANLDDVEVYLAYAVKLRKALGLTIGPSSMDYFLDSRVTRSDLDAARREVLAAEQTEFYRYLVVDDTWNTYIKQQLPEQYAQAEARLIEQAGAPLTKEIHTELRMRGVNPDDADAYRNIAPYVWRDKKYDILEPYTRAYLAAQNIPLPEGAANAAASG